MEVEKQSLSACVVADTGLRDQERSAGYFYKTRND